MKEMYSLIKEPLLDSICHCLLILVKVQHNTIRWPLTLPWHTKIAKHLTKQRCDSLQHILGECTTQFEQGRFHHTSK